MSSPKPMPAVTVSIAVKPQAFMRPVLIPSQCPVRPKVEIVMTREEGAPRRSPGSTSVDPNSEIVRCPLSTTLSGFR